MIRKKEHGGIDISSMKIDEHGTRHLNVEPYCFSLYCLSEGERLAVPELVSYSIFFLGMSPDASLQVTDCEDCISIDDVIIVEGKDLKLLVVKGDVKLLVAGVNARTGSGESIRHCRKNEVYFVNKPWGHELWINGEHPDYAFKELFIKQGHRTSLQYHRIKRETILFLNGSALVHYKSSLVPNELVTDEDIKTFPVNEGDCLNLMPFIIHRVEAVSDIRYFEVSTPHFDDIIRIVDDSSRASGRIATEHGGKL